MCAGRREGCQGQELLVPGSALRVRYVGWVEELGEDGKSVIGCRRNWAVGMCGWRCVPECAREGHVYLFQAAVGDVVDGLGKTWREIGAEDGFVSL